MSRERLRASEVARLAGAALGFGGVLALFRALEPLDYWLVLSGALALLAGALVHRWRPPVVVWCARCGRVGEFDSRESAENGGGFARAEPLDGPPMGPEPWDMTHAGTCIGCMDDLDDAARRAMWDGFERRLLEEDRAHRASRDRGEGGGS